MQRKKRSQCPAARIRPACRGTKLVTGSAPSYSAGPDSRLAGHDAESIRACRQRNARFPSQSGKHLAECTPQARGGQPLMFAAHRHASAWIIREQMALWWRYPSFKRVFLASTGMQLRFMVVLDCSGPHFECLISRLSVIDGLGRLPSDWRAYSSCIRCGLCAAHAGRRQTIIWDRFAPNRRRLRVAARAARHA